MRVGVFLKVVRLKKCVWEIFYRIISVFVVGIMVREGFVFGFLIFYFFEEFDFLGFRKYVLMYFVI